MKKRLTLITVLIVILVLGFAGCGDKQQGGEGNQDQQAGAGEKLTIKYSSVDVEDSAIGIGMLAFKDYVERESNGNITCEMYFNGQLGGDRQNLENVLLNTVQFTVSDSGVTAGYNPAFYVLSMPYMFTDKASYYEALDGELGDVLVSEAAESGFELLGFGDCGSRHLANSKREIRTPADASGLKIRVPESEINIAFIQALGASPTPISFSETYTALQQKVVDGLENPIELLYTCNFMEVQKYLTLTAHIETPLTLVTSKEFFNGLSDEYKDIIREAAKVQVAANRKAIAESESVYYQKMLDEGKIITELTADEMQKFRDALRPVYEEFTPKVGEDIVAIAEKYQK
ncbi:TRAP transporter substrate-binding protein [Bacillota bacterium]